MEMLDVRVMRSIPTPVADVLQTRGCRTAGDVLQKPEALHQSLDQLHVHRPEQRTEQMLGACRREVADAWGSADSALALLQQGQGIPPLVLPCQQLNALLGNALRPGGSILEVAGLPGTGKTQLCMQICAASQIPRIPPSGEAPQAVFIDAEGSFVAARYAQICQALLVERRPGAGPRELETFLRGMHIFRTYDATELFATLKQMGTFLKTHSGVRSIVVDSMAFYFRHEFSDNQPQKARILMDIATMLRRYGAEYQLNIVVTNHMTTRFERAEVETGNETGWLVPALGETWAHQPSTQLRLERLVAGSTYSAADGNHIVASPVHPLGKATLTKSVEQAVGRSCAYRITEGGLRDAE